MFTLITWLQNDGANLIRQTIISYERHWVYIDVLKDWSGVF